jgi:hypothetical protein
MTELDRLPADKIGDLLHGTVLASTDGIADRSI